MSARILYIHQHFVDPARGGGGIRSYEIARRLVAEGFAVTMLAGDATPDGSLPARETVEGIEVIRIRAPYANHYGRARRIASFLRFALISCWMALRLPADVIFATSTPLTVGLPALLARRLRGIPYVFEVRDLWPEMPVAVGALRSPALIALLRVLERRIYLGASAIVGLSPGMRAGVEAVLARAGAARPVFTAPNACDLGLFPMPGTPDHAARRAATRAELGIGERQVMLLYAGTFGRLNDLDQALDLAAATAGRDDIVWVLAGDGQRAPDLRARIVREELGNVRLTGPVDKARVVDLFAACDLGLSLFVDIPEMEKNSANKFFDTLAAGRAPVINYGGWQADLLAEAGIGLRLPRDAGAARTALLTALEDGLARTPPDRVRAVAARFSREACHGQVRAALGHALAKAGR